MTGTYVEVQLRWHFQESLAESYTTGHDIRSKQIEWSGVHATSNATAPPRFRVFRSIRKMNEQMMNKYIQCDGRYFELNYSYIRFNSYDEFNQCCTVSDDMTKWHDTTESIQLSKSNINHPNLFDDGNSSSLKNSSKIS